MPWVAVKAKQDILYLMDLSFIVHTEFSRQTCVHMKFFYAREPWYPNYKPRFNTDDSFYYVFLSFYMQIIKPLLVQEQ